MIAGIDGCKAGWLVALSERWPCKDIPDLFVCRDFQGALKLTSRCDIVVIDIPIGLPTGGEPRRCDIQARNELGKNSGGRVFRAPPRETLSSETPERFQAAHRASTGVGAGYPVWGIVPKLKEVDSLMSDKLQARVREFHPELTWARLGICESKHSPQGIEQRRDFLQSHVPKLALALQWKSRLGKAATLDDLFDAVIGLSVAEAIGRSSATSRRLPKGDPPRDAHGLRMEIWF